MRGRWRQRVEDRTGLVFGRYKVLRTVARPLRSWFAVGPTNPPGVSVTVAGQGVYVCRKPGER